MIYRLMWFLSVICTFGILCLLLAIVLILMGVVG